MKRRTIIVSIALHALLLMIVYIFQSNIFPYLRLAGLAPLLLPIASTGVAVYEGRYAGGIMGIFAGILCDVSFNQPAGVFTVLLTLSGLLIGTLADTVIMRGFVTFYLTCAAVLALSAFVQMFPLMFFEGVPPAPLLTVAFRQTVYSLILVLPIWFSVRALGKHTERRPAAEKGN